MILSAVKWLALQCIIGFAMFLLGAFVVLLFEGKTAALDALHVTVQNMKGPWVWAFGYGLMSFIMVMGKSLGNELNAILEPGEDTAKTILLLERSTLHRHALRYTIPITLLGVLLTFAYGIPLSGLGKWLVGLGIVSIYYVGAFLLTHFIGVTAAFHGLYKHMDEVDFRSRFSPLHLENFVNYLAITTGLGAMALYVGFRGTLTADFNFAHEVWQTFLITPLVLFLPATLFYNFYPRYVMRKIVQHKVFQTMNKLGISSDEDTKSLLLDIKETAMIHSQILPFLDYKTIPSYIISVLFVFSLAYHNDLTVKAFFDRLLGLTP